MGILLILAQIALVVLQYAAHVIHLNGWLVWLPAILLVALWLIGRMLGATFFLDGFKGMYQ